LESKALLFFVFLLFDGLITWLQGMQDAFADIVGPDEKSISMVANVPGIVVM
jgi:hypothetical protein